MTRSRRDLVLQQAGMLAPAIEHLAVDLVAEDGDLRMLLEPLHQLLDLVLGAGAARRVGRAVDDDQPGLRRDPRQHGLGAEAEAVLLQSGSGTGVAPVNLITDS